jgi:uncharacterized protein with von Willebrand factor type A (vWA) domain
VSGAAASPRRDLLGAVVRFCRLLRARGFAVTAAESRDALRAVEAVDVGDRDDVHRALRTVLPTRPEELPVFDAVFDAFWQPGAAGPGAVPPSEAALAAAPDGQEADAHIPRARDAALEFADWAEMGDGEGEPVGLPGVSDLESTTGRDFATFADAELGDVERLAAEIARRLATRKSRRLRPSRRRGRVDLRRTMRLNLTRADLVELARRRRRILKPKIVVLSDVSGSMDLYSRLLLRFLFALQNQLGKMETFVFSTRLTRITEELTGPSFRGVLERLAQVRDWSGGTRIGESLLAFHARWRHLVDRETVVIVLSDGWETGDPAELGRALSLIRRRAGKLIWLNPLLGSPDYQPLTQGMVAALPHVDAFLPAHNLDSLRALVRHLTP